MLVIHGALSPEREILFSVLNYLTTLHSLLPSLLYRMDVAQNTNEGCKVKQAVVWVIPVSFFAKVQLL